MGATIEPTTEIQEGIHVVVMQVRDKDGLEQGGDYRDGGKWMGGIGGVFIRVLQGNRTNGMCIHTHTHTQKERDLRNWLVCEGTRPAVATLTRRADVQFYCAAGQRSRLITAAGSRSKKSPCFV